MIVLGNHVLAVELYNTDNIAYEKVKAKVDARHNDGYNTARTTYSQYFTGEERVATDDITLGTLKCEGECRQKNIKSNVYIDELEVRNRRGSWGYDSFDEDQRQTDIGAIDLNAQENRNLREVSTVIEDLTIEKW